VSDNTIQAGECRPSKWSLIDMEIMYYVPVVGIYRG
jgi:hypothetical protein